MANPTGIGGWKPGQSGNPSGRPKSASVIAALAQEKTESALEVLMQIMQDPEKPAASRVSAAVALLDRGYGRPAQSVQLSGDEDNPIGLKLIERVIVDPKD